MTAIQELSYRTDAAPLLAAVRDLPSPVWLDSGRPYSRAGRFDIVSAAPLRVLTAPPGQGVSALDAAAALLAEFSTPDVSGLPAATLPFAGGLIGWLGYGLGMELQAVARHSPESARLPTLRIGFYPWAVIVDHQAQRTVLVFHPACPPALRSDVENRCRAAPARLGAPAGFALQTPFIATTSAARYRADIARILAYLTAGDCYQVNYAQHFSAACAGDPWQAYCRLRALLPSPFSAYLGTEDDAVLCFSPERFLRVEGDRVETRPIKGTIARGNSAEEDAELAHRLRTSAKDRAENLMIVDLLRNDLGKSCVPGSIAVPELFALESFANVHHLVSTVTGRLRADQTPLDLLANCFPGGSVTGAPKKRAMEIIAELEPVARALYCGSIFYLSTHGRMDSNIAIRTLVADGARIHCWGGGGIVADSDPEAEYQESLMKVQLLMKALNP
ncbi:MAG: aminodeoxychorismate synthase component I [Porticoccaceae bacterium]|nr:aminodeoxychorismate synthase component I [Gammaproteobacteria bacterium]TAL05248.1 MAG: aminodeoxychorismate synthase component I [Porticoccaceae bacterium]